MATKPNFRSNAVSRVDLTSTLQRGAITRMPEPAPIESRPTLVVETPPTLAPRRQVDSRKKKLARRNAKQNIKRGKIFRIKDGIFQEFLQQNHSPEHLGASRNVRHFPRRNNARQKPSGKNLSYQRSTAERSRGFI